MGVMGKGYRRDAKMLALRVFDKFSAAGLLALRE